MIIGKVPCECGNHQHHSITEDVEMGMQVDFGSWTVVGVDKAVNFESLNVLALWF